ncbi:TlpA family protein disulfide reductase [Actinokineospora sp. 24-640]
MRWVLVAVILLVAATVALWPRDEAPAPHTPPPGPDVAQARAEAALEPCAGDGPGPEQLRGVVSVCLGSGDPVDVADVLGGRKVLVNVWATWCLPCRDELPVLAEYAADPESVDVVTVAVQSNPGDALVLLRGLGVRLPTLHDESGALSRALRLPAALPASYLVGADGTVAQVTEPRLFRDVGDVRAAVGTR